MSIVKRPLKNNESGIAHLGIILAVLIVELGATGYYVYRNSRTDSGVNQSQQENTVDDVISELPSDLLTLDKVEELAKAENSAATITGIQLESEDGTLIYLVRFSDSSKLLFNAQTGTKVSGLNVDDDKDDSDDLPANFTVGISITKAFQIATAQNPNSKIKQIELEEDDSIIVYKVKFQDETKVIINAKTGALVKVEKKDSKESNKDDDKSSRSGSNSDSDDDEDDDDSEDLKDDKDDDEKSGSSSDDDSEADQDEDENDDEEDNSGSNDDQEDDN